MKNKVSTFLIILMALSFLEANAQKKFEVGVGIMLKSGKKVSRLKSRDRVIPGDKIRVFVNPSAVSYSYVLYSEKGTTYLINDKFVDHSAKAVRPLVLPSSSEYYEFDKDSEDATIAVICAKSRIKEIDKLFGEKTEVKSSEWNSIYSKLKIEHKADIRGAVDKPISMAGNVRDAETNFMNKLQLFTADDLIIRDYKIEVKK